MKKRVSSERVSPSSVSRRHVLRAAGTAAVAGGASVFMGGSAAAQQSAPAVLTNTQAGRRIRAFVKLDSVEIPSVQTVTLRALTGRQVAVRTEAAQTCYSSVGQVLLPSPTAPQNITVVGHGGVGIVEAVGSEVSAISVGDRVIVNFHSTCGWCYACVRSRGDHCLNGGGLGPTADLNGKPVNSGTSGMTEVMVVNQEKCVPVFNKDPPGGTGHAHVRRQLRAGDDHDQGPRRGRVRRSDLRGWPGRSVRGAGRTDQGRRPDHRSRADCLPPGSRR